jgi:hypothetical protein
MMTDFLWRQGPQERGKRFRFRMTLYWLSGEWAPKLDEVDRRGVGDMLASSRRDQE